MIKRVLAALLLAISVIAPAATAATKKPPEGMRKYYLFVRKPRPVPPGEKPEKIKEPDIEKLGGIVVETQEDHRVVFLPPSAAKKLRRDHDVALLQRVWVGESFDDWDESNPGASRSVGELTEETDLKWGPKRYDYDGVGNISRISDDTLGSSEQYTYDAVSRLTRAQLPGATETYAYDSFGNITSKQISGRGPEPMAVDSTSNRLSMVTYDVAGNVTSVSGSQPVQYVYDSLGMMTGYSGQGRNRRMYYTADDERIGTTWTTGASHWTIRDFGGRVLREFRKGGMSWQWVEDYIYADGRLVAGESINIYAPGHPELAKRHFHLDHLGTVRLMTSEQGKLSLGRHDYYPFGTEKTVFFQEEATFGGTGSILPEKMRFTGHERDFLGFWNLEGTDYIDYMHARYYNPNQGRFLSVDPGRDWDMHQPQSWNMYSYVRNNPVNQTDPTGKWCIPCLVPVGAVLVRVAAPVVQRAYIYLSNPANVLRAVNTVTSAVNVGSSLAEGIYEFPDAQEPDKTYVGQSEDTDRRIKEHEGSGKKDPETEATVTEVPGGKTAREHAEQNRINELGGKKSEPGSGTSNKVNPIGPNRKPTVQELYGPIKPPKPKVVPDGVIPPK